MASILIVGYGSHTKRRILPALDSINNLDNIFITSRNYPDDISKKYKYLNKEEIIKNNMKFDAVIISSYPSAHLENFEYFKNCSNLFLIEKPITNNLLYLDDDNFYNYFQDYQIKECLMYFHHPIYDEFSKVIRDNKIESLEALLTIPHIEKNNHRYSKNLGGSSILDQGIYPISLILENFEIVNDSINYQIFFENSYEIDTGGTLICETNEGTKINLKWGIGYEYSNNVKVTSGKSCFEVPMFFSKPENHISKYDMKNSEKIKSFEIGNHDQFNNMYKDIIVNNMNFDYQNYENLKSRYDFIGKLLND